MWYFRVSHKINLQKPSSPKAFCSRKLPNTPSSSGDERSTTIKVSRSSSNRLRIWMSLFIHIWPLLPAQCWSVIRAIMMTKLQLYWALLVGVGMQNRISSPKLVFQWLLRTIPKLTIIIGHIGELSPFQVEWDIWPLKCGQGREDCVGTVSGPLQAEGMFALAPLACAL